MTDQSVMPKFAICINNYGCDDLSAGMIDRVVPDEDAADEGLVQVVDDSGEDYLYRTERFVLVEVSRADVRQLLGLVSDNVA